MSEANPSSSLPEVDLTAAARSTQTAAEPDAGSEVSEIIASPPPRLLHGLLYAMSGLILLALVWSYVDYYDVIVSARGELQPGKPTGVVQSPVAGRLSELLVTEGAAVEAGQPVARIEPLTPSAPVTVTAPVAGLVAGIQQHHPGEILPPGQKIADVWQGGGWVARIQIANQNMGSVRQGQDVKIKLDAFPYQEYGALQGELGYISLLPATDTGTGAQAPAGPAGYNATVALSPARSGEANLIARLRPGLALTAEIVVKHRRILELLLERLRSS